MVNHSGFAWHKHKNQSNTDTGLVLLALVLGVLAFRPITPPAAPAPKKAAR